MPKRKPKRTNYPDATTAIRAAIADALDRGESYLGLERESGVSRVSMMHFMKGTRTLRMDIADKLIRHFGMTVTPPKRKRGS